MRTRPEEAAALVRQALAGSEDAYRDILVRFQQPVLTVVLRIVQDRGTAEDVTQEAFVKAFRSLASFQQGRNFSSWLFKIAHNTAIDHLRRRRLDTVPLETPDADTPDLLDSLPGPELESPEVALRRKDLATAIEEAISSLRTDYREVLELRFREGLSYEEIADVMELPLGTVKTHLHRARKEMSKRLLEAGFGASI